MSVDISRHTFCTYICIYTHVLYNNVVSVLFSQHRMTPLPHMPYADRVAETPPSQHRRPQQRTWCQDMSSRFKARWVVQPPILKKNLAAWVKIERKINIDVKKKTCEIIISFLCSVELLDLLMKTSLRATRPVASNGYVPSVSNQLQFAITS